MFFALGDLHLSHSVNKPMDIFGAAWENHAERIRANWINHVSADDVVLLPGDLSWAMTLEEAVADLEWMAQLPGRQIMIRGNHDYWWNGIGRVRKLLHANQVALQNDALCLDGVTVCGTRGWLLPTHPSFTDADTVVYKREIQRLKLSLDAGKKLGNPIVVMMHYPPLSKTDTDTEFAKVLEEYSVSLCVYGHLHGPAHRFAFEGEQNGVEYRLVSADYVNFSPLLLKSLIAGENEPLH